MINGFIPVHENYKELLSYQKSVIIYDVTFSFCKNFLKKGDRTIDQMVQAARSGKQNIIEGVMASGTSKETEIKLVNVARASLEELLEDYRDFLRTRNHALWEKNSNEAQYVRNLRNTLENTAKIVGFADTRPAEVVANIVICLIHQANYLLDRQLKRLEQDFLNEGGMRERMSKARIQVRNQQNPAQHSRVSECPDNGPDRPHTAAQDNPSHRSDRSYRSDRPQSNTPAPSDKTHETHTAAQGNPSHRSDRPQSNTPVPSDKPYETNTAAQGNPSHRSDRSYRSDRPQSNTPAPSDKPYETHETHEPYETHKPHETHETHTAVSGDIHQTHVNSASPKMQKSK
jgi:four helix bundle suffix protein